MSRTNRLLLPGPSTIFPDEVQVVGQPGGKEQIEFAGLKCGVGWRGCVPAGSAASVVDRIDQGICDRSGTEIEVEESPDLQLRSAWNLHCVRHGVAVRGGCRGGCRFGQGGNGFGRGGRRGRRCRGGSRQLLYPQFQLLDAGILSRQPVEHRLDLLICHTGSGRGRCLSIDWLTGQQQQRRGASRKNTWKHSTYMSLPRRLFSLLIRGECEECSAECRAR